MTTNFGPTPQGSIYISTSGSNTAPFISGQGTHIGNINPASLYPPGALPSSIDDFFPDDKDCPACASCKNGHTVGSIHWTGRECVMLLVCANCQTTLELEELPGGLVAKAITDFTQNMLVRIHEGEDIPADDAALLDWLYARLMEDRELIDDAAALVETMQMSLRGRSSHR